MKKILLIIVLIICILLGVFALVTVSSYPVGNAVDTIEIRDGHTGKEYEQFCKEQKALLDTYLQNNPYLSVLCFNYGYDKPDAIKLAAVCYNKSTNQDSNLLVFSDVGVGCLTFESDSTDVHYLSEYPLYIYDEDKIELPLFHYDKGLVIFHRVECNFNSETTDANFVVLEEARKSITEIEY